MTHHSAKEAQNLVSYMDISKVLNKGKLETMMVRLMQEAIVELIRYTEELDNSGHANTHAQKISSLL